MMRLSQSSGRGRIFLLALACCLVFVASAKAQLTSIKASAVPSLIDSNDGKSVELGVKFRADSNGYVAGLRFYKASANVGTHVGHLWSKSGVLLASATFTGETASGWQQVNFSAPIAVSANTTYVASYFAPSGHYSANTNFFATAGIDSPPLHQLANGVDGANGVYLYSAYGGFPSNTYLSTNYWVDVVYSPQATTAKPQLTVSTTTLSFGSLAVNSSATPSVTLTSSGTSAVTVNSASISGAGFSIVGGSLPATLNPNQSMTLQVQFKPTTSGSLTGKLTISSNSSTGSTAVVSLSGTGTAAAKPQLTVSTTALSFGSVAVNSSATKSVTLTSSGTSAVTVNSASISGAGFSIVAGTFPATLNPNQSLTLQLQFKPTTTGSATGNLTINSNSATGATAVVSLSGTATAAGNPQLTVSATTLSFGSLAVNTSATKQVTLTSSGTSAVTVNSAAVSGAGFSIVGGSFPLTLNAAQTATLQIQFKPTTAGAVTGQLTISSNSTSGGTALVALSGTGTAVAHSVNLNWNAPGNSPNPVVGYNVYRAVSGGAMQLMNSSPVAQTAYVDNTVASGSTYNYVAKSVDNNGMESTPSNQIAVTIP